MALFYIYLAVCIIRLRFKHRISLGDGGHNDLHCAMRAHGNFAEYIPLILVLMTLMELYAVPVYLLHSIGLTTLIGRILHVVGLRPDKGSRQRVFGMALTFAALSAAAVILFYQTMKEGGLL